LPEAAVPPRVVQEAVCRKEVRVRAFLIIRSQLRNASAFALQVERLRSHENEVAFAAENVRRCDRHAQDLDVRCDALACQRVLRVHPFFGQHFARPRVQAVEAYTALQEHGAAGGDIGHIITDQDSPMHGPHRFKLLVDHMPLVARGSSKLPNQLAVFGLQTIDVAVGASKKNQPLVPSGRRIDSTTRNVSPSLLARSLVDGYDAMLIDYRRKHLSIGNDGRA